MTLEKFKATAIEILQSDNFSIDDLKNQIREFEDGEKIDYSETIIQFAAESFDTTVEKMKSSDKDRKTARARWVFWRYMKKNSPLTLTAMSSLLNKTHGSVLQGIKELEIDQEVEYPITMKALPVFNEKIRRWEINNNSNNNKNE